MCAVGLLSFWSALPSSGSSEPSFPELELFQDIASELPNKDNSKLCRSKDNITRALNLLLLRLMKEDKFWNGTLDEAKSEMLTTLQEYLKVESVYRLAQSTEETSTKAATYHVEKIEQLQAQKQQQEKIVQEKKTEYPEQKQAIDADRDLILTLIKLVESLGSDSSSNADPRTAMATLKGIQADIHLFQSLGTRFSSSPHAAGPAPAAAALRRLGALARRGHGMLLAGQPTAEEIRSTKEAVRAVLLELLQDPAFRAFLLESGLADSVNGLIEINTKIVKNEEVAAELYHRADQARATVADTSLERAKIAGAEKVSSASYKDVSAASSAAAASKAKQIRLLRALIHGIDSYCRTGVFDLSV